VQVAKDRNAFADGAMDHRKMLQDSSWTAIVQCITNAILSNIQGLVVSRATMDGFQDAVQALCINFAEVVVHPWITMQRIGPGEAPPKEFASIGGIKAYQVTAIVVDAVIISRPWRVREGSQERIEGKGETARLPRLERCPVKAGLV